MGANPAPCRHMTVVSAAPAAGRAVGSHDLYDAVPAMAYVPWQHWNDTYETDMALGRGTIFPELDLPFCGKR